MGGVAGEVSGARIVPPWLQAPAAEGKGRAQPEGIGAWMGSPSVSTNSSDYPPFPGHPAPLQLAQEREAERATGKGLQPYKLTPLFIIFLSAIA